MEFLPYTIKWLEVILRWGHVLFAILWVGNSFLFNYLDNNLNKNITSDDIDGEGYLMHSGFFYKLSRLKTSPPQDYLNRLVICLLYTSPSPRDLSTSRMPSSA